MARVHVRYRQKTCRGLVPDAVLGHPGAVETSHTRDAGILLVASCGVTERIRPAKLQMDR